MKIPLVVAVCCTAMASLMSASGLSANDGAGTARFELRVECRKNSTRGCTAAGEACANAPAGRYFPVQSISGADAGSLSPGHTPVCGVATTGKEGVAVNGMLAVTSMCANLHAESGSGPRDIGKVFYTKCSYTAATNPLPE